MKLDRNVNPDGRQKYALLKLRRQAVAFPHECQAAVELLKQHGLLDFGDTPDTEFFVIRLKDVNSEAALRAYALHCARNDMEFAMEICALADKAFLHPAKRMPD